MKCLSSGRRRADTAPKPCHALSMQVKVYIPTVFVRMLSVKSPYKTHRTGPARHGWPREVPRRGAVATSAIRTVHAITHGEVEGDDENGMLGVFAM